MNNFPAMTKAQRQELIKMAKILSSGVEGNLIANLAKVALAALTAEPVGWMVKYGGIDKEMFVDKQAADRLYHDVTENGFLDVAMLQLYTAPSAPVLKPIELPGKGGVEATSERSIRDWSDGWAAYREEAVKVIRDAGYDVKA